MVSTNPKAASKNPNVAAWKDGQFRFSGEALSQIIPLLEQQAFKLLEAIQSPGIAAGSVSVIRPTPVEVVGFAVAASQRRIIGRPIIAIIAGRMGSSVTMPVHGKRKVRQK